MSSSKASKFMDAQNLEAKETVSATRKLGAQEAATLIKGATRVIIAKGKKVVEFRPPQDPAEAFLPLMLGSTGNLRAPTLRQGKTVVVGYDEATYQELFS